MTSAEQTEAIRQSMQDEKVTKDEVIRELEEEIGSCPWEESEPDPDILRDDTHERARLAKEFSDE